MKKSTLIAICGCSIALALAVFAFFFNMNGDVYGTVAPSPTPPRNIHPNWQASIDALQLLRKLVADPPYECIDLPVIVLNNFAINGSDLTYIPVCPKGVYRTLNYRTAPYTSIEEVLRQGGEWIARNELPIQN